MQIQMYSKLFLLWYRHLFSSSIVLQWNRKYDKYLNVWLYMKCIRLYDSYGFKLLKPKHGKDVTMEFSLHYMVGNLHLLDEKYADKREEAEFFFA